MAQFIIKAIIHSHLPNGSIKHTIIHPRDLKALQNGASRIVNGYFRDKKFINSDNSIRMEAIPDLYIEIIINGIYNFGNFVLYTKSPFENNTDVIDLFFSRLLLHYMSSVKALGDLGVNYGKHYDIPNFDSKNLNLDIVNELINKGVLEYETKAYTQKINAEMKMPDMNLGLSSTLAGVDTNLVDTIRAKVATIAKSDKNN